MFGAGALTLSSLEILIPTFEEWKLLGSCSIFSFWLSSLIPKAKITELSTLKHDVKMDHDCTHIYNSQDSEVSQLATGR